MITRVLNWKIILILFICLYYLLNSSTIFAIGPGLECFPNTTPPQINCDNDPSGQSYSCQPAKSPPPAFLCQPDVFGRIKPPAPLADFLQNDPTGAGALSQFLSNLIALIFAMAAIVLIFMIIWGAFDWLISEGDKEKIAGAQKKIISALIGFVLLSIAFAILRIFGQFTGFTFFTGQNYTVQGSDSSGNPIVVRCSNGSIKQVTGKDPSVECQK